jgi:DNA-binding response OmpR family regulator
MAANPTVLIIDDDPMNIQLVTDTLRQQDYAVISAPDGPQGLRAMYEHHPDLIILDVNMPTMDGWTVCQRIREVSNVPVVMLTARDAPEEIIKGLDIGADDYVTKPFEIKVLSPIRRSSKRTSFTATITCRSISTSAASSSTASLCG